jgi:molybdenum-dependent DNA-binding transcriptional regulator ModE
MGGRDQVGSKIEEKGGKMLEKIEEAHKQI